VVGEVSRYRSCKRHQLCCCMRRRRLLQVSPATSTSGGEHGYKRRRRWLLQATVAVATSRGGGCYNRQRRLLSVAGDCYNGRWRLLQWALAAATSVDGGCYNGRWRLLQVSPAAAGGRYKGRRTWLQPAVAINRAPPCCKEAGETNETGGEAICDQRCRSDKNDSSVLLPVRQRCCRRGSASRALMAAGSCVKDGEGGEISSLFFFFFVLSSRGRVDQI
jgi:hypothetical protein